jgi:tetratricopeptide (TPR) repeat protein
MQVISYSDKFDALGRQYLLQTSLDQSNRNIICSLFSSGRLLSSRTLPSPENMTGQDLAESVQEIHRQYLADFNSLFRLTDRIKHSDKPELIEKLGRTLYSRSLYNEGLELLRSVIERHSDYPGLRILLGRIWLALGRFDDAEKELLHAVQLAPEYPDLRNLLGIAFLKSKKPAAAIGEFKKAVKINVYFHNAYFNLGLGYIQNGIVKEDFNLAKNLLQNCDEVFARATMFNPAYLTRDYEQGRLYLARGKLEEAYEILSKVADLDGSPDSRDRLLEIYLRYVHGEGGMTEEGISKYIGELMDFLKANPGYADLQNELGLAYTVMAKFMNDKAIERFREALKINSGFSRAGKNLKLAENDLKGFEILLEAIFK